eukprot:g15836.t1
MHFVLSPHNSSHPMYSYVRSYVFMLLSRDDIPKYEGIEIILRHSIYNTLCEHSMRWFRHVFFGIMAHRAASRQAMARSTNLLPGAFAMHGPYWFHFNKSRLRLMWNSINSKFGNKDKLVGEVAAEHKLPFIAAERSPRYGLQPFPYFVRAALCYGAGAGVTMAAWIVWPGIDKEWKDNLFGSKTA